MVWLTGSVESETALRFCVIDYYQGQGRKARDYRSEIEPNYIRSYFLVDRRHAIRYAIVNDPKPHGDLWLGNVELGIGPDWFGPMQFWSYDQGERFSMEPSTDAVVKNLRLLDGYWRMTGQFGPLVLSGL